MSRRRKSSGGTSANTGQGEAKPPAAKKARSSSGSGGRSRRKPEAGGRRRSSGPAKPKTTEPQFLPLKSDGPSHDPDVIRRLMAMMAQPDYRPSESAGLAKRLNVPPRERDDFTHLLEKLEREGQIARIRKTHYLLPDEADLFPGKISIHPNGFAHVLSEREGLPDLFIAAQNTGTAMHGDRILARIMREGRGGRGRGGDDRIEGRVLRILERGTQKVVGTLQRTKKFYYVVSDDPRFVHNIYVDSKCKTSGEEAKIGEKVVVDLEDWESRHVNPEGEIIEILGAANAPGIDILSIIRKYNLSEEFPPEVLREAEAFAEEVDVSDLEGREDWRDRLVVTIDPDDARDFDDGIHVEQHANGWTLAVHIADVSHYVRPGTALDKEAQRRGNSVYLPDRVIPMLPESLSNGLCSLNPKVPRFTQLAVIEFDKKGHQVSSRFAPAVIQTPRRFTYKEAFAILQREPENELDERIHIAWSLAAVLRKNRFANGSLELDFPEVKVIVDEDGRPIRLEKVENDISHQLVEECMLAANQAVGAAFTQNQIPAIYRVHEKPDSAKLVEYREYVKTHDIKIGDLENRAEVSKLLKLIRGIPEEYAIKLGLLKSLKKARYSPQPLGHYGLAMSDYTHFTSPIRRYADLIVHRAMALLQSESGHKHRRGRVRGEVPKSGELSYIADHISATERVAIDAEREATKLKQMEYFQAQLTSDKPDRFAAVVVDVRNYGLLVELTDFLVSGLIHVSTLDGDFYRFDSVRLQMIGQRSGKVYKLGDKLTVSVDKVDIFKKQVDFRAA